MTGTTAARGQVPRAASDLGRHPAVALVSRLGALLAPHLPEGTRIQALKGRRCPYASTHALEELDLELSNGSMRRLMLKGFGLTAASAARGTRPAFMTDPYRELWAYEVALPPLSLGTPTLYGTLEGNSRMPDRLVLERVEGVELYQLGECAAWEAAGRWLSRLHARGSPVAEGFAMTGTLMSFDAGLHMRWMSRARRQAARLRRASRLSVLDGLSQPFQRAVQILEDLPRTLIHGEFYPANILVRSRKGSEPASPGGEESFAIAAVDWESIGIGPGVLDLAALTSGDWDDARRRAVVGSYLGAAAPAPACLDTFELALASARLVTAVQWLGWSEDWVPPPERAHDWEREAVSAGERLR